MSIFPGYGTEKNKNLFPELRKGDLKTGSSLVKPQKPAAPKQPPPSASSAGSPGGKRSRKHNIRGG